MNKQERIIAILLGLCLAGWLYYSVTEQKKAAEAAREAMASQVAAQPSSPVAEENGSQNKSVEKKETVKAVEVKKTGSVKPEQIVVLSNAQEIVELSTRGASVKSVKLLGYARDCGEISEKNPPVVLDFASSPALSVEGDFEVAAQGQDFVCFRSAGMSRRIKLAGDYRLEIEEESVSDQVLPADLPIGVMAKGSGENDLLSIDSWLVDAKGGHVIHHGEEEPLESYLVASAGGCSGKKSAAGLPETSEVSVPGPCSWIAVKNRFFVTAICGMKESATDFKAFVIRDANMSDYVLKNVSATVGMAKNLKSRKYTFFAGPKKQSLLWDLGMRDVMEFGMWRWVCYPMVWLLNVFHSWIPSFGIGIILLTIFVRLVFWPLTHKSTISMRRMSEIQPKMKELREKFKDNPQRLQQETWALYRDNKVNPMASCLPMLVQIPVFIALFTVLRSAVELRYAPFLWIADLSEPENLFPGIFPFGGLNILPILMAVGSWRRVGLE
ncbi:MAG: YidC/Oxa1 family insertase periplasmic-domain containing protein [Kiritimatiellae bacterium]|nr:YidC/Oxa1 family insertase periplasmic-domain containing protein [Kiritimatiellia bacterium]